MQSVRRAYLYFIAAVSLAVLAVGLANLLGLAFEQISESLGWRAVIGRDADEVRRQVSLFTALVLVALPIWLVHWWLAERSVLSGQPSAEAERQAATRALYLTLVLLATFQFWLTSGISLLQFGILKLFNSPETSGMSGPMLIAVPLVTGTIWAYHVRVYLRDIRLGPIDLAAIALPRLYRYIALFVGAIMLLTGATQLLNLVGDAVFGTSRAITVDERWWVLPLSGGISAVVVGLAAWSLHWWYSIMTLERDDWYGLSEQRSMLRRVYLYLIVGVTAVVSLVALGSSLVTVLRAILDVSEGDGTEEFARHLIEPLVGALPFLGFWLFHKRRIASEALRFTGPEYQTSASRFYRYGLTFIGLAFTGVGTAYVAGILIDLILGGSRTVGYSASWWRGQVSQFGAITLVGASVWLWHWYTLQRQRETDPEAERATTSRRLYLYLSLAGALVATLAGLSVIIYRLFNVLLNVTPGGGLVSSISAALGVTLVAVALLVYHGLVLNQDRLPRPQRANVPAAAEGSVETIPLELTGPAGADLDAELSDLRAHLPQGFSLRHAREHAIDRV